VGAFSGVENAKMWGSTPEMPKTGSPLAKGELRTTYVRIAAVYPPPLISMGYDVRQCTRNSR
jgi:hypothetical protein